MNVPFAPVCWFCPVWAGRSPVPTREDPVPHGDDGDSLAILVFMIRI